MNVVDQIGDTLEGLPVGLGLQDMVVGLGIVVRPRSLYPAARLQYLQQFT